MLEKSLIKSWNAWSPALDTSEKWQRWIKDSVKDPFEIFDEALLTGPSVSFLPASMKKKLSPLSKVSLYLMNEILLASEQREKIRIIMSSRFGEAKNTVELLHSIGKNEPSSPMAFSRSVHNSSIGIFSIFAGNKSPATAISAMNNSFGAGLLESLIQLYGNEDVNEVLYVFSDEKIPLEFTPFVQDPPVPYGVAFIFAKTTDIDLNSIYKSFWDVSCLEFLKVCC